MPIDCIMLLHFSWNARDSICRKCINKNTLRKTFAENLNFRHTPSYAKCFDTSAYQQTAFERPKIYFITENRRRSRFSIEQYEMVLFFGVGCQTRVVAASGHYSYSNKQTSLRMAVLEISRGETRHFYSVIILKKKRYACAWNVAAFRAILCQKDDQWFDVIPFDTWPSG